MIISLTLVTHVNHNISLNTINNSLNVSFPRGLVHREIQISKASDHSRE